MNKAGAATSLILVDHDATARKALSRALAQRGHRVETAATPTEALALVDHGSFDVALVDLQLPDMDGIRLMHTLRGRAPDLPVIIMTGRATIPSAIDALQAGAWHYLQKPCDADVVEATVRNAAQQRRLLLENLQLKEAMRLATPYQGILGTSPAIRELVAAIEGTKDSWSPVLIEGEIGSGKELIARTLHTSSTRRERPFVAVNCATLDPAAVEDALLGPAEGAGPGGNPRASGLLEVADGGTLFVDQIADLSLPVQAGLLRVLETGAFRPRGASRERRVKLRIIAATNRELQAEVDAGRFRQDLFFRLDIVHLVVPPLRSRPEDIPPLTAHHLENSREAREKGITLLPEAVALLTSYPWPGNVRELFHVLDRAVLLSPPGPVGAKELEAVLRPASDGLGGKSPVTLEDSEKIHIARMLAKEGGNVSRVSELLGIDRRTLQRKMKRYGLR